MTIRTIRGDIDRPATEHRLSAPDNTQKLGRRVEPSRDHVRGGNAKSRVVNVVSYADFLCPYCRRFRTVLLRLRQVFGERLSTIPVCAPKAAFGECMGVSGALCAVVGGLALEHQCAPPTAGFSGSDSGLRLSAEAQPVTGEYALINAFGCDGNNASLVIRLWKK